MTKNRSLTSLLFGALLLGPARLFAQTAPAPEPLPAPDAPPAVEPSAPPPSTEQPSTAPPAAPPAPPPPPLVYQPAPRYPASPSRDAGPAEDRPAPPEPIGVSIYGNVDQIWNTDPTYDLFSDRDVQLRPGLSVSLDLLDLAPRLVLAPELGWSFESASETALFGIGLAKAEYDAHAFQVGAGLRYELLPWLEPRARLMLGLSLVEVEVADAIEGGTAEQSATSPFASLGAGVELHTRPGQLGSGFQLGALVEGGYLLGSAVDLDLEATDSGRISTEIASLGELARSGPYLRIAAFVRF